MNRKEIYKKSDRSISSEAEYMSNGEIEEEDEVVSDNDDEKEVKKIKTKSIEKVSSSNKHRGHVNREEVSKKT